MDGQTTGTTEVLENQAPVDPWVAAFEALEQKGEEASETAADTDAAELGGIDDNANAADGQDSAQTEDGDGASDEDHPGGLDTLAGTDTAEDGEGVGSVFDRMLGINDEAVEQYEKALNDGIREQAMHDIANEFLNRNIRHKNGVLGVTLDDEDICKRDSDGVPHFYNPETGREFTGDNPRRQAQEWVDDYNRALADAFNKACAQYENHLREEAAPQVAVMKFVKKYEKLDEIRRGMFENMIEGYEIKDNNGDIIGYNCDLDKALEVVERQVNMIQNYAKKHQGEQKHAPTGPALDMKTSSGAVPSGDQKPPSSLIEAMERIQDRELAKLKK